MIVSEARLAANRANGAKSKGPVTEEGKANSRRNALKHGLSGEGIVRSSTEADLIEARAEALEADMKPISPAGAFLIGQMATLSVRLERASEHESAAIAYQVRHAADAFDEERLDQTDDLFELLGEDPRNTLRKLRKSPEGVDLLIEAWRDLRNDLSIDPTPEWTATHLDRAANLLGLKSKHGRSSRIGALSRAYWGDFAALGDDEGADLDDAFRRDWAKAMIFDFIDAEIAGLEAHYETLDFETIELDRAEAGARVLFDPSKKAILARRYEAEARRSFFKALKEFRLVEAESAAMAEAVVPPVPPVPAPSQVGSFRQNDSPPDREPRPGFAEPYPASNPIAQDRSCPTFRPQPTPKSMA